MKNVPAGSLTAAGTPQESWGGTRGRLPAVDKLLMLWSMKILASLFIFSAVCVSSIGLFAHSANEPAPRTDQGWIDRQKILNQRAIDAGDKAQIIFIGDSITHGWEGEGKEVWARYYAHRNAVNLGIGGDRTQHVLWRLDNGNLNGIKPKAAVLMIGTNNSNGEDNSVEQIADGITAIVQKLRLKLPDTKVLLLAIFPRSENPTPQRGKLLMVNQIIRKLADERNVFWIDFGHQFLNSDGTMPRELMPDFLHLSKRGYEIWAEAIEDRLSSVLSDSRVGGSAASGSLTGEWNVALRNQEGQTFDFTFIAKSENGKITGKFSRDENRWLEIENGKINGNEFSWTVTRDRPDGSKITYAMSGKMESGKLKGVAKAKLDGEEITNEWTATRK
ncbi:MAG: platelet-activating factor acetylhydrolase IB subunit [Verrucomicrobiota bacterium]